MFINMITINDAFKNKDEFLEILWAAFDYFPEGLWQGIKYLGNIALNHNLKIKLKKKVYSALIFNDLIRQLKEIKKTIKANTLLLTLTKDPVIAVYTRLEVERFERIINLVHDYVSTDVGILSLFGKVDEKAIKMAAHGLGHNKGLEHHLKPVDLMYAGLLKENSIESDGFCVECQKKLKNRIIHKHKLV